MRLEAGHIRPSPRTRSYDTVRRRGRTEADRKRPGSPAGRGLAVRRSPYDFPRGRWFTSSLELSVLGARGADNRALPWSSIHKCLFNPVFQNIPRGRIQKSFYRTKHVDYPMLIATPE